ncbi:hypothetical protein [Pyrinomonas sp.]|uniref:hypothetical protein n=1 Tax=Pyrinomonas sp. TaxID=2080306 RepID=UPI00331BCC27
MGGIADYSGALVLELPVREATFVAVAARRRAVVAHRERAFGRGAVRSHDPFDRACARWRTGRLRSGARPRPLFAFARGACL